MENRHFSLSNSVDFLNNVCPCREINNLIQDELDNLPDNRLKQFFILKLNLILLFILLFTYYTSRETKDFPSLSKTLFIY